MTNKPKLHDRMSMIKPSATMGMAARAKALKQQGIHVINLTTGEPDFRAPKPIIDAAKKALDEGVDKYTPVRGTDEIVDAMQIKFKREQGVSYDATQVLATVGAKAAIAQAIEAVAGPGDEVVVLSPYWVSYPEQVALAGAVPVIVPARAEDGFVPKLEAIRQRLNSKTKAIILNSPNNPSGAVYSEQFLRGVMDLVRDTPIWVVSDEIYERLLFDDVKHISPASFSVDAFERTIVISGVAKSYAMTGWRIGVAGGPKLVIDAMIKLQSQRYTCATAVAQAAAAFALREPPEITAAVESMRVAYQTRRDQFLQEIAHIGRVKYFRPQGAFYALLDFSSLIGQAHRGHVIVDDQMLADRLLDEAHIAMVAGGSFGVFGGLRASLAASSADLHEAASRLKRWLE